MPNLSDLLSNPFGALYDIADALYQNLNYRHFLLFGLASVGVFVGAFALIFLVTGLITALIGATTTLVSQFFSGFFLTGLYYSSSAILSGFTFGLNAATFLYTLTPWFFVNLSLISATAITGLTHVYNPGMLSASKPIAQGDPNYQSDQQAAPLPGANPYANHNLQPGPNAGLPQANPYQQNNPQNNPNNQGLVPQNNGHLPPVVVNQAQQNNHGHQLPQQVPAW